MATILIVEDDRAILKGLETNLEFEGHAVHSVLRGDEAMPHIEATHPDLLILDVMLPGLSGFDICRLVRRVDQRLPILLLTARSDDVDKVLGLDLGADDYLTKPFSLTELLARVRALLRRADNHDSSEGPASVAIADAVVDFRRYVAMRDGQRVHLTMKEFGLLRELVSADGAVLTRDAILERVWGGDVNVTTRTVDTHVLALRQKLEPNPSQPAFILTVHGVGYRFASAR